MNIDGKLIAERILQELGSVTHTPEKKLCFIVLTDDPVIEHFVQRKINIGERLGVACDIVRPQARTTEEIVAYIGSIQNEYDGIVVQLPLPLYVDVQAILDAVPLEKDIDMLSSGAKAAYAAGTSMYVPPVAAAVAEVLKERTVDLAGKNIVVIGHGRLVGEPVALMLEHQHAHYKILDLATSEQEREKILLDADVVISGAGVAHMLTPDMVHEGVVLIDAGTSEQNGKMVGDIDPACYPKAAFYTPVPGGIGPITVAVLFRNLLG